MNMTSETIILYKKQIIMWNERQQQYYCQLTDEQGEAVGLFYYEKLADMKRAINRELQEDN